MQCSNNLKQIAFAVHNYNDQYGQIPQGTMPNDSLAPEKRLSWQAALLPYLEQDKLYTRIDTTKSWETAENREPVASICKTFLCASEVEAQAFPNVTHYVGLAGIGEGAAMLPKESPRAGLFGYERIVTLGDITDGTSNTILAVESFVNKGPWAAGGPATVREVDAGDQPYIGIGRPFGRLHARRSWFGAMPTSANVAFADASVRPLDHSIKPETFEALVTIAGGEEADAYDY